MAVIDQGDDDEHSTEKSATRLLLGHRGAEVDMGRVITSVLVGEDFEDIIIYLLNTVVWILPRFRCFFLSDIVASPNCYGFTLQDWSRGEHALSMDT